MSAKTRRPSGLMAMPELMIRSMDLPSSSSPFHWMEPEEAFTRPVMVRRVVVFPQPEGPRKVKNSPSFTWILMS